MARQRGGLVGRQAELDALAWDARAAGLTVVRGIPGSGKSALLAELGRRLRESGLLVLEVGCADRHAPWDRFGVTALLSAVRAQFESLEPDARLPEAIETVGKLCTEAAYQSPWSRFCLLNAMGRVFARIGTTRRVAVLVDDVHRLADPVLAVAPIHRAGHFVVASWTGADDGEPAGLPALADRLVDLSPLPDEDIRTLLRKAAGAPLDAGAEHTLREALGSLQGNPGTLVSTMEELRRARRLAGVHGTVCLRDPKAPIPLPDGHELLAVLDAHGDVAREIVLLAASAVGLRVDELPLLAAAKGRVCADYGHAADQLVLAGILDSDLPGRLRCRHPALVAAVVARAGNDALRQLHRLMAEQLLDIQAQDGCRAPLLAGHVAGAGATLPQRPDLVELLRDEGLRLELTEQGRCSEHLHAAWWHAGPGEERGLLRWELIQLFVRTGRYEELAAYVAEELESGAGSQEHAELAAAAALAAVHLGRPVPASIRERLSVAPAGPLDFAQRWFDGEPIRPEDVMASFGRARPLHDATLTTIAGRTRRLAAPDERIAAAAAVRDLVPVFEAVLGSAYRAPEGGPAAAYHRLCAGYGAADWEGALSAARELELCPDADAFALEHARLLAAEMCAWRGENRRATAWLESVPEGGCLPVLRGWVATGILDHGGDPSAAAEHGWAVYQEYADGPDELALDRLLLRLAWIAEHERQPYASRRALAEAEARRKRAASPRSLETASLIRALMNADNAAARVAEQLVRPRGEGFDLVLLALIAGRISGAPHGWLREAYDVSQTIGASRLVALAKCSMDRHGVAAPATRPRPAELSGTELHIIDLIRQGRTNRQIADTIRIGEKTVEKHLTRLFVKAGCRTRHGLATSALGRPQESVGA